MNCHEFQEILGEFLDQKLDGKTRKEFALHLAGCEACTRLVEDDRTWDRAVIRLLEHEAPADLREEILGDVSGATVEERSAAMTGWRNQAKIIWWAATRRSSPREWLQVAAVAAGALIVVHLSTDLFGPGHQPFDSPGAVILVADGQVLPPDTPLNSGSLSFEGRLF